MPPGDSALIELGGLPAADRNHWPYSIFAHPSLRSREVYVSTYFPARAKRIRAAAVASRPDFVWMYGSRRDYMLYWETIAGGGFGRDEGLAYDYRADRNTLFVVTDHTTFHRSNAHRVAFGKSLRERVESAQNV